jgi:hypothetical protein
MKKYLFEDETKREIPLWAVTLHDFVERVISLQRAPLHQQQDHVRFNRIRNENK